MTPNEYIESVLEASKLLPYANNRASTSRADYFVLKLFKEPEQPITNDHLDVINALLEEHESRLADLLAVKTNLKTESQGIQQQLAAEHPTYAELVASGDIAAADAWKENRTSLLTRQHVIQDQLSGFTDAETILNGQIDTYTIIKRFIQKGLLLVEYHNKMQTFTALFEQLKTEYLPLDELALLVWGDDRREWEHRNAVLLLANIQPELIREFHKGAHRAGMNAELMVVDRITKGLPPFVNPEAAVLLAEKMPDLAKALVPKNKLQQTSGTSDFSY